MIKFKDEEFSMDGYLKDNLDIASKVIRRDLDMVFSVDGPEGSGKSVFTMQAAYYVDPTFDVNKVVFTPKAFREAIINSKPYQAVVYDEAYTGLSSRATMSLINRTLISMLAEIRQKNLFVFVVMPTFFDLDRYVALWRSRALIHVYFGSDFQRGYFAFYNSDKKKDLYIQGKKFYSYSNPRPNFIGRFTNFYTIDESEYRLKKKNSLVDREKKAEEAEKRKEIESELFERMMGMKKDIPHSIKMEILGMPSATYFRKLKQYEEMREIS